MKKRTLFFPVLAALTMAGCSNDESGIATPSHPEDEASYLAVNIVTPTTAVGRATSTGFEEGTAKENAAEEGLFLFFDAAGNATQTPQTVPLAWEENSAIETPAVEKVSEAVLVIAGNTQPAQLLVILNAPDTDFNSKTLAQVRETIGDYSTSYSGNELDPLVITNSTYLDGTTEVCATDIENKTYKSQEEARSNPVDVYVERVVAKVRTSAISENFTKGATINVDGKDVTLSQTIEGIEIANIAGTSYLFKNIDGSDSWAWTAWNDATNYRSYWATCPGQLEYANQSWNVIDNTEATSEQTFYVQENTSATKSCVLVTATLKNEEGNAYDFVRWAGNYYTPGNFKSQYCTLLKNAGFLVKTDENGSTRTINVEDIEWLSADAHAAKVNSGELKGYESTVQLTETAAETLDFVKDGEDSDAAAVNAFLLKKENLVWYWNGGKAYYFVNIEHFGTEGFDVGVVRNHIYDLTLNSLTGVGVAVFNPDETIIPEKPSDDLYYLAAKINILKWRLVSQTVNFE